MFSITSAAAQELSDMLREMEAPESTCLRLKVADDVALLQMDTPRPGDEIFRNDEHAVLVADPETCEACSGMIMHYGQDSHFCFLHSAELN